MSVPMDDSDSYNDLQLDFSRKNHAFDLDNVGYITKESGSSVGECLLLINNFKFSVIKRSTPREITDLHRF